MNLANKKIEQVKQELKDKEAADAKKIEQVEEKAQAKEVQDKAQAKTDAGAEVAAARAQDQKTLDMIKADADAAVKEANAEKAAEQEKANQAAEAAQAAES